MTFLNKFPISFVLIIFVSEQKNLMEESWAFVQSENLNMRQKSQKL